MKPGSGLSSSESLVLNLKLGANTCSINNDAVIAFSILFTDNLTKSSAASGWAIKLVNCACVLLLLSLVQRPIICMISVKEPLYPTVRACSQKGQSNPSFAIPKAIIKSMSSTVLILRRYPITFSRSLGLSFTKSAIFKTLPSVFLFKYIIPVSLSTFVMSPIVSKIVSTSLCLSLVDSPEFTFGI